MHGGPLKPSVHLFSFRDLVQRKRKNKGQREFVHQVGTAPGEKIARDLVQRKRRNKGQREFVHQVGAAPGRRPATSASGPIAPPAAFPSAARRQSPQPVVKSTHMSTFVFFRIIIKSIE